MTLDWRDYPRISGKPSEITTILSEAWSGEVERWGGRAMHQGVWQPPGTKKGREMASSPTTFPTKSVSIS